MTTQLRNLTGTFQPASTRRIQYNGREHLVVPVVALIGGAVVRPLGAKGPEYVPPEELSLAPQSWNGRPVVLDHPMRGSAPVSANSPGVLESSVGTIFDTRYHRGRLKMSAYLDVQKMLEQGGEAAKLLASLEAGRAVEVSVGAWITAEPKTGRSAKGDRYTAVWRDIVPDHLAMLPEGATGACSVEMGCGAPRAAQFIVNCTDPDCNCNEPREEAVMADATDIYLNPPDPYALALEKRAGMPNSYGLTAAQLRALNDPQSDDYDPRELPDPYGIALARREESGR